MPEKHANLRPLDVRYPTSILSWKKITKKITKTEEAKNYYKAPLLYSGNVMSEKKKKSSEETNTHGKKEKRASKAMFYINIGEK